VLDTFVEQFLNRCPDLSRGFAYSVFTFPWYVLHECINMISEPRFLGQDGQWKSNVIPSKTVSSSARFESTSIFEMESESPPSRRTRSVCSTFAFVRITRVKEIAEHECVNKDLIRWFWRHLEGHRFDREDSEQRSVAIPKNTRRCSFSDCLW
jgi:hypothetical protein